MQVYCTYNDYLFSFLFLFRNRSGAVYSEQVQAKREDIHVAHEEVDSSEKRRLLSDELSQSLQGDTSNVLYGSASVHLQTEGGSKELRDIRKRPMVGANT